MRWVFVAMLVCVVSSCAFAQERFVERAPRRTPVPHTMERAGYPTTVKPNAIASVPTQFVGGYIGGAKLRGNNVFARGAVATVGAIQDGTYGIDYAGIQTRPGRVFLAPSYDPSIGPTIARAYRTDGPQVLDVFSLRPVRKAVIEAREAGHEHE
ncbi:MAG: hypothetical protein C0467_16310 [Planctomycetaceae bacterium]|nr:hypothetical protein [Planctomycetaceae bacterium]